MNIGSLRKWCLALSLVGGCASDKPARKCEGEVFGVGVNCHEVAATAAPSTPRGEAGPSSQPSGGEIGPSSQPSEPTPKPPPPPAKHAAEPPRAEAPAPKEPAPAEAAVATTGGPGSAPAGHDTPSAAPPPVNVVYFKPESSVITTDSRVVLDSVVDYLKKGDDSVSLRSFVDPTGNANLNERLLHERAEAVHKYIIDAGVPADRVKLPSNFAVKVPKDYPAREFWRLRKVVVDYSSKGLAMLEAREEVEDQQAEEEAKPAPRPHPKKLKDKEEETADSGKKLQRVDVLYWKYINHSLLILAKRLGYFEDEGLDVRLHDGANQEASQLSLALAENNTSTLEGSRFAGRVMKKRKYFLGAICPYGFYEELGKKVPLVQIGGLVAQPSTMIMRKELVEAVKKNIAAFRGKTIARQKTLPTEIDYTLFFTNMLKKRNIEYQEKFYDSTWNMEQALAKGEVDALMSTPPWDVELLQRHPEMSAFEVRSLYPLMPCCRQVVTREQLREKSTREQYVKFERAVIRAHKYQKEHAVEAADILAKAFGMKPTEVRSIFLRPGFSLDPNPNTKGSVAFYNTLQDKIGKQDVKEAIDTSIYEEALFSLARENGSDEYFKQAVKEYRLTN